MKNLTFTLLFLLWGSALMAFPTTLLLQETIEIAAKVSGKHLSPSAARAAVSSLSKAAARHGDDVLRVTREGGLEALSRGAQYGSAFWHAARHAEPAALRSLLLHTDELLPLARRLGPDFLKLEAKVPGVAARAVELFGDDAVKILASLPPDDIARLTGIAKRAETRALRGALLEKYSSVPDKEKFLSFLNWKNISAAGFSAAAITLAYRAGGGVGDGLATMAEKDPAAFSKLLSEGVAPFKWLIFLTLVLALFPVLEILWKWSGLSRLLKELFKRKKKENSPDNGKSGEITEN